MPSPRNQVRIIAGEWRGRKLGFPDVEGLRPTADRIRETLFNWLMPIIPGATCLDLFAGSGALGFEAASRGAAKVLMLEQNPQAFRSLKENCKKLAVTQIELKQVDALQYLAQPAERFDVVFIDPPFQTDYWREACRLLKTGSWLNDKAVVYLELNRQQDPLPHLAGWEVLKSRQAGQVRYMLLHLAS